jgi:hypothetical protein
MSSLVGMIYNKFKDKLNPAASGRTLYSANTVLTMYEDCVKEACSEYAAIERERFLDENRR